MWAVLLLGVIVVVVIVAMCSGEKETPPRVRGVIFVDPPAKSSSAGETILGVILFCGMAFGAAYALCLLLPYLLGLAGIVIVLGIVAHCVSGGR
jgi:hypothetical protein